MGIARDMVYATAALASSPLWLTRLARTGKWRTDWPGRFGSAGANVVNARNPRPLPGVAKPDGDGPTLLIHAVSVGEVNATRHLVAQLKEDRPDVQIVIAATTDTGVARARELFGEAHRVVRYPLDFSFSVKRFLDAVHPSAVALMELEVWPTFVEACETRGIGVCVINGRLSERSFQRYRWIRALVRATFAKLAAVGAQTPAYAERFKALGVAAERVQVLDTMKWDNAVIADQVPDADELAQTLGLDRTRPVVVAGSTGPGEERMLIEACPSHAQLLLVPRKPERFDEVAALEPGIVRKTSPNEANHGAAEAKGDLHESRPDRPAVFLLDTMGELRQAYALADVAVVGRSFNAMGGSDPIEPVALGKATVIGPGHHHFAEVVAALDQGDGLVVTDQPGQAIARLLDDASRAATLAANGRAVIEARQGATRQYAAMIERVLPREGRTAPPGHAVAGPMNGS